MNPEMIMKSDVLDILFENRNKNYGAYDLRKFYNNRMKISLVIMTGIVIILCSFSFIPANDEIIACDFSIPNDPKLGSVKEPKPQPKESAPKLPQKTATAALLNNIVITNDTTNITKLAKNLDSVAIGSVTTSGEPGNGPSTVLPGGGGKGIDSSTLFPHQEDIVDINKPVANPDILPSFPGGMNALRKFLERNLRTPEAMAEGELVSVKVKFIVGYDGKLQSFEIIEDGGKEYNKEVIRVLNKMPDWIPGKSNGRNVPVYHMIPVKFIGEAER